MNVYDEYKAKCCSADQAVKLVKDGDWVDYSMSCAYPTALDKALARRRDELQDIKVRNAISCHPVAILEADPETRPLRTICGTAPASTGSISMPAGLITNRCSSATAAPITAGALHRSTWP